MKIPQRTATANSAARLKRLLELEAQIKQGIASLENACAGIGKMFNDPFLDTPMDAKAYFAEEPEMSDEISDIIIRAVIGLRFSKAGLITRREINYLREVSKNLCDKAPGERSSR